MGGCRSLELYILGLGVGGVFRRYILFVGFFSCIGFFLVV